MATKQTVPSHWIEGREEHSRSEHGKVIADAQGEVQRELELVELPADPTAT